MAKKTGIKIVKSKKKGEVFVHVTSKNGNILVASETFKNRKSAFKNILATAKLYASILVAKQPITDEDGVLWVYDSLSDKFIRVF